MTVSRIVAIAVAVTTASLIGAAKVQSQPQPQSSIVVVGEGSVRVAPDHAQVTSGVTTRAKTVKEAIDTNSRQIAAVIAALTQSGIAKEDIQTSRFSLQPIYSNEAPRTEPKLTGYAVSNQLAVRIREIGKVGDILDRLVSAGATDIGNISFLVSEPSKTLDQARETAIADARRRADVYARAAKLQLGEIEWISEDSGFIPAPAFRAQAAAAAPTQVPIAAGEDTLRVRITVGFAVLH